MRAEIDEDFERYVTARQRPALRAAYLTCLDPARAREVAEAAFAALAQDWSQVREDRPDDLLRARLYRGAVAAADPAATGDVEDAWAGPDLLSAMEPADQELRGEDVLRLLPPRQRAFVVLIHHDGRPLREAAEALGIGESAAALELDGAMATARERRDRAGRDSSAEPYAAAADPWADLPAEDGLWDDGGSWLAGLLERSAGSAPDVDLAASSWDRARRASNVRVRRIAAAAVVLAAVAALVGTLTAIGNGDDPPRLSRSGSTGATSDTAVSVGVWDAATSFAADGTPVVSGPSAAQLPGLDMLDVGLPREIGWDRPPVPLEAVVQPRNGRATVAVHVSATMLRSGAGGLYEPVLLLRDDRTGGWTYASVDATLIPTGVELGADRIPVPTRAIDATGTKVTWVQPDGIVVADVRTGGVRRISLPDDAAFERLYQGGFDDVGQIVVQSAARAWRADPDSGAVQEVLPATEPARARFTIVDRVDSLVSYSPDGQARESHEVRLPIDQVWGDTVSGPGWAATGALVRPFALGAAASRLPDALVAASLPDGAQRRALVFDDSTVTTPRPGSIRALAITGEIVVFSYSPEPKTTWLLGLDLGSGQVTRVSRLLPTVAGVGTSAQPIAVWVPDRG